MTQSILIPIIVVLFMGAMATLFIVAQQRIAKFDKACADRGWLVEKDFAPGFSRRVSGSTGGVNWVYTYVSYGNTNRNSGSQTRYGRVEVREAALPGDVVLILPHVEQSRELGSMFTSITKLGSMGRMMVELFVVNALGGSAADVDAFMRLVPVESGSESLRRQHTVLATSEEAAAKVLGRSEGALLGFAGNPAIPANKRQVAVLAWSRGLTLPVRESITDIAYLDALTTLAAALANSATGW